MQKNTNKDIDELVNAVYRKLDSIYCSSFKRKKYETALKCIETKARIEYLYNQCYTDLDSENRLLDIADTMNIVLKHKKDNNVVLFYDGFGLDKRGIAYIYLKALDNLGFRIIYITNSKNDEEQPLICKLLINKHKVYRIKGNNICNKIDKLVDIINKECFSYAFLYTTPYDLSSIITFNCLKGNCKRFLINLTDHAFWLGINSFDKCIEFRNYGLSVSKKYRNINRKNLFLLQYYPLELDDEKFEGFPFNDRNKKIVFSGGQIYKTLDKRGTFYKIVEDLIQIDDSIVFVYASNNSTNLLDNLCNKYPKKVFHIKERNDLNEILKRAKIFINTYPIGGALMVQYAAKNGCIPVTFKDEWNDDYDGLLINEDKLETTFSDYKKYMKEIYDLLNNDFYYAYKKTLLMNSVINEKEFTRKLYDCIYIKNCCNNFYNINTEKFRSEYKKRFDKRQLADAIINKENLLIISYFFDYLFFKVLEKCKKIVQKELIG